MFPVFPTTLPLPLAAAVMGLPQPPALLKKTIGMMVRRRSAGSQLSSSSACSACQLALWLPSTRWVCWLGAMQGLKGVPGLRIDESGGANRGGGRGGGGGAPRQASAPQQPGQRQHTIQQVASAGSFGGGASQGGGQGGGGRGDAGRKRRGGGRGGGGGGRGRPNPGGN
jgi:hypothetical protein